MNHPMLLNATFAVYPPHGTEAYIRVQQSDRLFRENGVAWNQDLVLEPRIVSTHEKCCECNEEWEVGKDR